MSSEQLGEAVSVENMKLRDLGNSYGFTVSKDALEELGLIDDDGDLVDDEIEAKQKVHSCGKVCYRIPLSEVDHVGK